MGNATRASRGKPHIFLTVENRVGPASRFRDSQSTAQPLRLHFGLGFYSFGLFCNLIRLNSLIIGFLFVVPLPCYVASSIPNITVRDLPFTTLGCRYPRPDFHRLDVRHARRTNKQSRHRMCRLCCHDHKMMGIKKWNLSLSSISLVAGGGFEPSTDRV